MQTTSSKDTRFWNRIAKSYARRPVADEEAYQVKLAETRQFLTHKSRVLEFGCGTGSTALEHAPHVESIDAIDISEKMIAIAKTKAATANIENVSFKTQDIATLEADDETYDAVLGLSILHLLPNYNDAIARVAQLLKPGGVFVTSTACLGDQSRLWSIVMPVLSRTGLVPSVKLIKQEDLIREQSNAGLKIVHQWKPSKSAAVFLIARKTEPSSQQNSDLAEKVGSLS